MNKHERSEDVARQAAIDLADQMNQPPQERPADDLDRVAVPIGESIRGWLKQYGIKE